MIKIIFIVLCCVFVACAKIQWAEIHTCSDSQYDLERDAAPTKRVYHAAFCHDDDVYIYGGHGDDNVHMQDVWKYEPESQRWFWFPNGPPGRSRMASWTLNGVFWIFGGINNQGGALDDFWKYNVHTRQWNAINAMGPSKRWDSATWVDPEQGRLYVYGGRQSDGSLANATLDDLWYYDVYSNLWHVVVPSDPEAMAGTKAVQVENKAYLLGQRMWIWDSIAMSWSSIETPAWNIDAHYTMFVNPLSNEIVVLNDASVFTLDLTTHEWTSRSGQHAPSSRRGAAYCTNDEGITFLSGGSARDGTLYNDVWEYGEQSSFAALHAIFEFDLNYINVALSYCVAGSSILFLFAIGFALAMCILNYRKKKEQLKLPIQL